MYTDKRHVLELIALLKAHNINKVVVCPGSRNIPIAESLSVDNFFTVYPVTDERSASFFAMGLALHGNMPVAICCTSGSALLNIHPAVSEAFYQKVPLLVISADRPKKWIGQMDGQTMPQYGVFGSLVKHSVDIDEENDISYTNRLINEAIIALTDKSKGPTHINIRIEEPFFSFHTKELPNVRVITKFNGLNPYDKDYQILIDKLNSYKKRMVLVGQMNLIYLFDKKYIKALSKHFTWITENLSNQTIPAYPIKNADQILVAIDDIQKENLKPDLLITYGGHIVSKRIKRYLAKYQPKEHWHISENGEIFDLFGVLTTVIEISPFEFLERISSFIDSQSYDYPKIWENLSKSIKEPNFSYSHMSVMSALFNNMPENSVLHISNSSSIRYAQLFNLPNTIEVLSNRGINGIEGSMSTALGYSVASSKLNFLVIGDLSFFYDMNALWNKNYGSNIRILLINNDGGEIFYSLDSLSLSEKGANVVVAPHGNSAKSWAEDRAFLYLSAKNQEELNENISKFTDANITNKPILLEVFTDKETDTKILKEYYNNLNIN